MTPFGLIQDREEAIRRCVQADVPPQVIEPVPVAVYLYRNVIAWYELCIRGV